MTAVVYKAKKQGSMKAESGGERGEKTGQGG